MLFSLSIVIPAHNEAENIEAVLLDAFSVIDKQNWHSEIIVIDDGSTDDTASIVIQMKKSHPELHLVQHTFNTGYGAAVYSGMLAAKNDFVFFTDGDGQFGFSELPDFVHAIEQNHIVIGYRINRQDYLHRKLYAKIWSGLIWFVTGIQVRDLNCAYKLFPKESLRMMDVPCKGGAFNADVLWGIQQQGYEFTELPVTHYPRKHGQSSGGSLSVIVKAICDLLYLFFRKFATRRPKNNVSKNQ